MCRLINHRNGLTSRLLEQGLKNDTKLCGSFNCKTCNKCQVTSQLILVYRNAFFDRDPSGSSRIFSGGLGCDDTIMYERADSVMRKHHCYKISDFLNFLKQTDGFEYSSMISYYLLIQPIVDMKYLNRSSSLND